MASLTADSGEDRVRRLALLAAFVAALSAAPSRADIVVVADPDKWIEQALKDLTQGRTDEFARNFLALIDKPGNFDSFAGNLRPLGRLGSPLFLEKISDVSVGTVMREVNYLALFGRTNYTYFKFTMKKNRGGWLISNFEFKVEPADLYPKDFATPK